MTLRKHLFLISAVALSAGCGIEVPHIDNACDWVMPISPSQQDQLADGTVAQILAHNEVWEEVCGSKNLLIDRQSLARSVRFLRSPMFFDIVPVNPIALRQGGCGKEPYQANGASLLAQTFLRP